MILQNPAWLIISILSLPLIYNAVIDKRKRSRIVSLSYAAIIITVSVAAASPAIETEAETQRTQELVFLNDNSRSMLTDEENLSIGGVRINKKIIASGNSSNIAKSMMAALEPNKTYLISSDLRTSEDLRDVAEAYRDQNSTLNFLDKEMEKESSVKISGPELTVPNAKNRYYIDTHTTGEDKPDPTVEIEGEPVQVKKDDGETFVEYRFQENGYKKIKASINSKDRYSSNNVFYKSVKVIEKPEILVVGERGSLGDEISDYFQLDYRSELPEDLESYYSVILKKKTPEKDLKPYLADGNGVIYTGNTEEKMDVLPVKKTDVSLGTENPKIVIGIDSSEGALQGSEGWGDCGVGESIKESKSVATSIITSLAENRPSSIVGAFSYNNSVFSFGSPRPLTDKDYSNKLLGSRGIPSIPVCGTAYHVNALRGAQDMMAGSPGNIVLVTDGNVPPDGGVFKPSGRRQQDGISHSEYRRRAINEASQIEDDVTLHIVGVDEYNSEFIDDLAEAGGGESYEGPEEFFELEKRLQGGGGDDLKGLTISDNDHFITRSLGSILVSTSNFDEVKAKNSANVLLSTSTERPFLTTWRYGLGRVAAFSGGDENLERVVNREPRIVSRTLSWVVGNPQRKNEEYVSVESGRLGQEVVLRASYPAKGFIRSGENEYRATVNPETLGFHNYVDNQFAYNYRKELEGLGYRRDLMDYMASTTGGEILDPFEVVSLRDSIRYESSESVERVSLTPYILLLALIIFLAQVGYRKKNGWM